jgi:hypothetical protein
VLAVEGLLRRILLYHLLLWVVSVLLVVISIKIYKCSRSAWLEMG